MARYGVVFLLVLLASWVSISEAGGGDRIIGYRSGSPGLFFMYARTADQWQMGIEQTVWHGWPGLTDIFMADINGDGIDDKVLVQPMGSGHQFVVSYSAEGDISNTSFNPPNGELHSDWTWLTSSTPVLGDIDGDGIDDNGVVATGDVVWVGGDPTLLVWSAWQSDDIAQVSRDHGGGANHTGWEAFGLTGDRALMGDFNGDGIDDRVLHRTTTNQVFIDFSNPAGGYGDGAADITVAIGQAGDELGITDINGDGFDDLVLIRANTAGGNDYYDLFGRYTQVGGVINAAVVDVQALAGVVSLGDVIRFGHLDVPLAGDADRDDDVDFDDLMLLAFHWLDTGCTPANGFCGHTDFDRSSAVDLDDYGMLADNWQEGVPATYYVSSSGGSDGASGLSEATAWQTFANLNGRTLLPGERVLLKRGGVWTDELNIGGSGTAERPIELGAYGTGPKPQIVRSDRAYDKCIVVQNPSYWRISGLDCRSAKIGIYLRYIDDYFNENVTIEDCYFQDMDNPTYVPADHNYEIAWSCGIWLGGRITASQQNQDNAYKTVLTNWTVRNCHFVNCATGISDNWYWSFNYRSRLQNVVLEDCTATGVLNGIFALNSVDGGYATRCRMLTGRTDGSSIAESGVTAAFMEHCQNYTVDDCEFAFMTRDGDTADGIGFDFEGDNDNCFFTNNVVHDCAGAGLMVMTGSLDIPNTQLLIGDNVFYNNAINASSSSYAYELLSHQSENNGAVDNCGLYRSAASSGYISSRWNNFSFSDMRQQPYSSVTGRPVAWEFNSAGDLEGWNGFNEWSGNTVSDGVLWGSSDGNDPYAHSPATWVNTHQYRYVRIRMKQTLGTTAQVFFTRETDGVWNEDKSVVFSIVPDGAFHEYVIDMRGQCPAYKGVVTQLRLDPTDAAGSSMAIDYVRFSEN